MKIELTTEDKWLELRRNYIGGSEVATLFGLNPFKSYWQLWMEKAGKIDPVDMSGNDAVNAGKFLEPAIAEYARYKFGMFLKKSPFYLTADSVRGMGATLDYQTDDGIPVELKYSVFGKGWEFSRDDIIRIPENYILQVQQQIECCGAEYGWIIVFNNGSLYRAKIERRQRIIDEMKKRITEFWASVDSGIEPPLKDDRDVETAIKEFYSTENGEIKTIPEIENDIAEYQKLKDESANIESKMNLLKYHILEKSGEASLVNSGKYELNLKCTKDTPEKEITAEMVGQKIGGKKGYRMFKIKEK